MFFFNRGNIRQGERHSNLFQEGMEAKGRKEKGKIKMQLNNFGLSYHSSAEYVRVDVCELSAYHKEEARFFLFIPLLL